MCYATKHLETLKSTIKSLKQTQSELRKRQQECDQLLSAKYHELEVKRFNAAEGYYMAKGLQAILQERRIIKHELDKVETLCRTLNVDHLLNSINKSNGIIKNKIQRNTTYTENFDEDIFNTVQ